ncbi:hypothetical protein HPP92_011029 [Vanilla planifolia]|uniref:Uncharacterized protein n=1 Tax=Vanilla planifolia TaxID=51239 RepID=A0A835QUY8_VANPL|nr:hypothetical protein HPP92_011029 [Vanilla planifolia]
MAINANNDAGSDNQDRERGMQRVHDEEKKVDLRNVRGFEVGQDKVISKIKIENIGDLNE